MKIGVLVITIILQVSMLYTLDAAASSVFWVPNTNEGTISKIDTLTGNELGRYRTGPTRNGSPSRTAIDQHGNVWVANRFTGTVLKIGLYEKGQYVDRNGDGVINTSRDLNNDGDITGNEILPWGQDECVLLEVLLIDSASGPRGLIIDANNNLWAGTYRKDKNRINKFYYIDGDTGKILDAIDMGQYGSYGAIIDSNGFIWSVSRAADFVLKINPATHSISKIQVPAYGITLHNGHVYVTGAGANLFSRITIATHRIDWTKYIPAGSEPSFTRGIAIDSALNVWVADTRRGTVTRWDHNGRLLVTIPVGKYPTGVAIDAAEKIWVCNLGDEYIHRIDPATNKIDLSKRIIGGRHYSYGQMIGGSIGPGAVTVDTE